jgi:hypothetical protein
MGSMVLALWGRRDLAQDAGLPEPGPGFGGVALAHNVRLRAEVDAVLAEAERAGGRVLKPAEDAFWGGHSGYFVGLDGHSCQEARNGSRISQSPRTAACGCPTTRPRWPAEPADGGAVTRAEMAALRS